MVKVPVRVASALPIRLRRTALWVCRESTRNLAQRILGLSTVLFLAVSKMEHDGLRWQGRRPRYANVDLGIPVSRLAGSVKIIG
ncbi:MAG: hypothetical protein F6K65_23445 [Moorea sp. SIO3C2]|nr:hypothetical protein [Moorena sp. SIO3C2]